MVLALAEFGLDRAALVIVGMIEIDTLVENVLSSMLMSRGLSLSPTPLSVEVERSG
jgi:predicted PurR-regulated permease PerM